VHEVRHNDLSLSGLPPGRFHGNHAIVIGASISGLLAARVLSAHFDRVTVFDRDVLPSTIENRRAVPQGQHGHGLLASGLRGLKTLFPAIDRDLLEAGAVPGDVIGNLRWFQHGHYKARFASGLEGLLLSRPLLEGTLRRRVLRLPNVRILDHTSATALVVEQGNVQGVHVRVQQPGEAGTTVTADLVVDASGRASRSPEWLESFGYGKPAAEEVHVGIGYTTRIFRRSPHDLDGDMGALLAPKPPHEQRIGFMLAMEGNRWMVTLGGWLGNHAPIDPDGYLEFARTLSRPDIYDVIKHAEPLTHAVTYAFPSNLRRRYEAFTRFPGHYVVMGDALCSFNPLYGQGMSVATLEALALRECLEQAPSVREVWRPFFKTAGKIIDGPWMIAAGSDFAFAGVTGAKPRGTSAVNWYLDRVHRAASSDRHVCRAFFDVANLLKPAPSLFRPSILARVWRECVALRGPLAIESDRSTTTRNQRMLETH
jgi:2-polyprenyl-6-methoxyphenol hydroxylase-like FAD-dependent oxidoreductase